VIAAFAAASPTSVSRPRDERAWRKAAELCPGPKLAEAAQRYLGHVAKAGDRVFSLERWLRDAKWEPFLAEPKLAAAGPAIPTFEGPERLMALLRGDRQRNWPAYLGTCRWDDAAGAVIGGHMVTTELRRWFRVELAELGIKVLERGNAA
jgi:hypothetical protein